MQTLHNALLAGEGLSVGAVEALLLLVGTLGSAFCSHRVASSFIYFGSEEYPLRIPHSAATPETHLSGMLASAAVRVATSLGSSSLPSIISKERS